MKLLTIRNRFPKTAFKGMYDGVPYEISDRMTIPDFIARHLKKQSIIKDNPVTGEQEYRLTILEEDGDVEDLELLPRESLDRSDFADFRKVEYRDMRSPIPAPAIKTSNRGSDSVVSSSK